MAYPTEGKEFVDGKNVMPYDRILLLTDYFNHGGLVYILQSKTVKRRMIRIIMDTKSNVAFSHLEEM